jgi:hypothetical protein
MSNIFQPAFDDAVGSLAHDNLMAGSCLQFITESILLDTGNLLRGALLGKITVGALTAVGAASTPAPAAATITAEPTAAAGTAVGVHRFECQIGGSATASKWAHYGPDGAFIGTASGNTAYTGGGLTLTITDAGTDPVAGEAFIVTVTAAAGTGKYVLSLAAATDGSQTPVAILAEDANATSGDVTTVAYLTGEFNIAAITFGTGHTAASVKEGLANRGIFLKTNLAA